MTIIVNTVTTFAVEVKRANYDIKMVLTPQQTVFVWSCITDTYNAYQTLADNPGWQKLTTDDFELEVKVPFHNDCCHINPMTILLDTFYPDSTHCIHLFSGQEIEDMRVAIGHAMRE